MKYSLFWLAVAFVFAAWFLAATVYASMWKASVCVSLTAAAIATSSLGAIMLRGRRRAFAIGCTWFMAGYLLLVYAPFSQRHIGPRLISTKLLGKLEELARRTPSVFDQIFRNPPLKGAIDPMAETLVMLNVSAVNSMAPQWDYLQIAGHCMLSWILGWAGGWLATRMRQAKDD